MRITGDLVDVVMYQIEKRQGEKDVWHETRLEASDFGEPTNWARVGDGSAPLAREFSACGNCWQTTGEFGTFSLRIATEAFATIVEKNPTFLYRLIRRRWRIVTQPIGDSTAMAEFDK